MLAELDQFHYALYGFKTDNPDKYIGLLNENLIPGQNQADIDRKREVLRMVELKDLHHSYQYFNKLKRQNTSQYEQDGVI